MGKYSEKFYVDLDFHNLMQDRIRRILLVCSSYDQFTLEEDGHIEAQMVREYNDLNLTTPPSFVRVSSGSEALERLRDGERIDLIITMFNIGEMDVFTLSREVRARWPGIPFVLMSSFSREVARRVVEADTSAIDYMFSWQGNADLILAIVKMLEDRMNAREDILGIGVQAILLVEDNVRFYSAYLPALYRMIIRQGNEFVREALNEQQRMLRKRARPKILFARSYDEAARYYELYKDNLLGIISDVSFSRRSEASGGGEIDTCAGLELCRNVLSDRPTMPIVLQSTNLAHERDAVEMGADFIHKRSPRLLSELSDFIDRRLAFGDFVFYDPMTGEEVARVGDLAQMQVAVERIPTDTMTYYTARDMLSKWLYARGIFSLAHMLRGMTNSMFDTPDEMRKFILDAIKGYRRQMGQGVVAEFVPETYNRYISFARSGSGSLGGKARGLAFIGNMLEEYKLYDRWEGVRVTIPRTLVLATDHFDRFIAENGLQYLRGEELDDADILSEFSGSRLPDRVVEDLRVFLRNVRRPLAVRSSSKLEDSHFQPFAGIYSTYMVPRVDNEDQMIRMLGKAIKGVYASVYYRASRAYIEASANSLADEKMAVVIQEICGTEDDGYYFPTLSGVARSLNFYPIGDERPEDGIANIALGLGKLVVEGGITLRFSPAYPQRVLQLSTPELMLRDTQRVMYALSLDPSRLRTSTDDAVNLVSFEIPKAAHFRNMKYVASTWDAVNQAVSDSPNEKGRKLITFAHMLKYDTFPLAEILRELLRIGAEEMKSPVEIEFAVNMDVPYGEEKIFNFLQIRPIAEAIQRERLDWSSPEARPEGAILYAESALGLGRIEGLRDVIYVKPGAFERAETPQMAAEIDALNTEMKRLGLNYILVGPGRWGSSDPWLGIPVKWPQISEARVIAECGLEDFRVDPSQGTHFFQNLTSFGVGYLTLNPAVGDGVFDVSILDVLPSVAETEHFRRVAFPADLFVFVDGQNNRGIIRE
ncbi:MAG: phosphoenolpyruvate synthase [Rikenella sp.]|nr:phosphoenolpyruvate synthase [Rikenella sp.]